MKPLITLPTWIMAQLMIFCVPTTYTSSAKKYSLRNWYNISGPLNKLCGLAIWYGAAMLSVQIYSLAM